jgi:hypothetical protein
MEKTGIVCSWSHPPISILVSSLCGEIVFAILQGDTFIIYLVKPKVGDASHYGTDWN